MILEVKVVSCVFFLLLLKLLFSSNELSGARKQARAHSEKRAEGHNTAVKLRGADINYSDAEQVAF